MANDKLDRARSEAIAVVDQILVKRVPPDEAISEALARDPTLHRAWLVDVVSGSLRWRSRIDLILDSLAARKKPTGHLREALALALYQVLEHTRVVPAQIVSETVDWVRAALGEHPARFANAVLRRAVSVLRSGSAFAELEAQDPAAWNGLPSWAWDKLADSRGEEFARAYGAASLVRPTLWLRERNESGIGSTSREAVNAGSIEAMPDFAEGKWIVQDISNQKLVERVAETLRAAGLPEAKVLDLCAAPGGKTVALAWEGFRITAVEIDREREALLDGSIARAGLAGKIERMPWEILEQDAARTWDAVWVDAPCTSFGLLRRHPEIRWRKSPRDLLSLPKVQAELLKKAYGRVSPGGFLFYSVCSPFREEGEAVLETLRPLADWEGVTLSSPAEEPHGDSLFSAWVRKS